MKYIAQTAEHVDFGKDYLYYWIQVFCSNCGYKGLTGFVKGVRLDEHACPKCEIKTLEKKHD